MRYLEYWRSHWVCNFLTHLQGNEIKLLQPTCRKQQHHLPSRSTWEGWIQVLAPRFRLHDTLKTGNANAGGSAICSHKNLLPDDAVVIHVVTCQGCDHIVNVRSGCQSLIVVNVHFEPELNLRSLRERLSHHATLASISWRHWYDHGRLQYLRARGRKIQCLESDLHWWWHGEGYFISFITSSRSRNRPAWL